MTVSELIEKLKGEDPDRIVLLSKDSEGNLFSPLASHSAAAYEPATSWYGTIGLEQLTEKHRKEGYSEEDVIEGGQKAIVLWPTN